MATIQLCFTYRVSQKKRNPKFQGMPTEEKIKYQNNHLVES
jgi:hypothetical protein